jgi:Protein of unknown function (DUF2793)
VHNEALHLLDMILAGAVEEVPRPSPPAAPAEGACYIIAAGPTGEWAGRDAMLAEFSSGGWRYVAPLEGMNLFVRSTRIWALYRAGVWDLGSVRGSSVVIAGQQVVGPRAAAIGTPAGGSTVMRRPGRRSLRSFPRCERTD